MSETRLLIDLGNSRAKWMWTCGQRIDPERTGSGDPDALASACRASDAPRPDAVLIASVAGAALTRKVEEVGRACWGIDAQRLQSRAEQGGVRNAYDEPARLGVDRWLAIVGAVAAHGAPLIVWDVGTAATLDAVDADGRHLGGWIVPGPSTMLKSLRRWTRLPAPEALENTGAMEPGQSTSECISRGVVAAQLGALTEMTRALSKGGAAKPRLVISGGAAGMLLPSLELAHVHDPWLVFRGMLVE